MHWRITGGLVVLGVGLGALAVAGSAPHSPTPRNNATRLASASSWDRRRRKCRAGRWDHRAALGGVSR